MSTPTSSDLLFTAIRNGALTEVDTLISADPRLVNTPGARGMYPLTLATYVNNRPVTERLLTAGANVNARDAAGNTALMGTCFKGYGELAGLLIGRGAEINARNQGGTTALSFAAQFGQREMVAQLLAAGADKTLADAEGLRPADHAAKKGFGEIAALLTQ